MSLFRYEAIDRSGKLVRGAMSAPDEVQLNARLTQMGYRIQSVIPVSGSQTGSPSAPARPASRMRGASTRQMAGFFRQFAALARSGISLYQAMEHLAPRAGHPALAEAAREMADAARAGGRVSDVMERYPRLFPSHVVAAVRAGELGGFIDLVLDEIAYDYEQELALYKGLAVPRFLVIQGLFVIAVGQPVFPWIFPKHQLGTYFALVFLRNVPILLALLLAAWLWYRRLQEPQNREKRDRLALKLPVFGELARQKALASFIRTLRKLYAAGVGPISAWEGAMHVAPNAVIREKLVEAHAMIRRNVPLHEAFAATGLFATEAEQYVATGMVAGAMVDMLDRVADFYQENVERALASARFWMFRIGFTAVIILGGIFLILFMTSYFSSIFQFVEEFIPEAGG